MLLFFTSFEGYSQVISITPYASVGYTYWRYNTGPSDYQDFDLTVLFTRDRVYQNKAISYHVGADILYSFQRWRAGIYGNFAQVPINRLYEIPAQFEGKTYTMDGELIFPKINNHTNFYQTGIMVEYDALLTKKISIFPQVKIGGFGVNGFFNNYKTAIGAAMTLGGGMQYFLTNRLNLIGGINYTLKKFNHYSSMDKTKNTLHIPSVWLGVRLNCFTLKKNK